MSPRIRAVLLAVATLAVAGCFSETREWMKVDQTYTTKEFQRDYRECERGSSVDEPCMRMRGWVPVNPSKGQGTPQSMDPLTNQQKSRGRY